MKVLNKAFNFAINQSLRIGTPLVMGKEPHIMEMMLKRKVKRLNLVQIK